MICPIYISLKFFESEPLNRWYTIERIYIRYEEFASAPYWEGADVLDVYSLEKIAKNVCLSRIIAGKRVYRIIPAPIKKINLLV